MADFRCVRISRSNTFITTDVRATGWTSFGAFTLGFFGNYGRCLHGKGYARAIRTHKVTLQALWQLLLPQLSAHLDSVDVELRAELDSLGKSSDTEAISQMVDIPAVREVPPAHPWFCQSAKRRHKCRILVELHGDGQHLTLLHQGIAWWIMGTPPVCFQAYASIRHQIWPCKLCTMGYGMPSWDGQAPARHPAWVPARTICG